MRLFSRRFIKSTSKWTANTSESCCEGAKNEYFRTQCCECARSEYFQTQRCECAKNEYFRTQWCCECVKSEYFWRNAVLLWMREERILPNAVTMSWVVIITFDSKDNQRERETLYTNERCETRTNIVWSEMPSRFVEGTLCNVTRCLVERSFDKRKTIVVWMSGQAGETRVDLESEKACL